MAYQFAEPQLPDEAQIGFDIQIPEEWNQYDLSSDGIAGLRKALLEAASSDPRQAETVDELFQNVAQIAHSARSSGLLSAAGTFERYEDGFFMATVCVLAFKEPPGQELDPIKLLDHVHPPSATKAEGTWLRKSLVELPESGADLCARMFGVADYKLDEEANQGIRSVLMHTAFRVPGLKTRVLVSCSSPNVEYQSEILELFDAITATSWFWKRLPDTAPQ
ncbi:hypothetical protein [Nocardiopsis suaedae]|uniref:DUF1795 domain-containing protein n=1 Tax=Nocardiopsis suaedae TaxID=3018444 RepID=A0ABT4TGD1_9ACTN|nr:hypothetical protein [Nocardiopsis suaedae]MDA2803768.1 hypothetical protein [Nocardiopsis suaedae]